MEVFLVPIAVHFMCKLFDAGIANLQNYTANRLEGGDVLREDIASGISTELRDISSKLDALSYREVKSSIHFLKDGFTALDMAIDFGDSSNHRNSERPSEIEEGAILTLPSWTVKPRIRSEKDLDEAKKLFHNAFEDATRAFSNAGLNIADVITACKLRIISRTFKHIDDPIASVKYCLGYLWDLHDIQRIKENFSVHERGGIRAFFKSSKRCEIVDSVTWINYVLFNFVSEITALKVGVLDWPMIHLGAHRFYHPICEGLNVLQSTTAKIPWEIHFVDSEIFQRSNYALAINSVGEIIAGKVNGTEVKITHLTDETDVFCKLPNDESTTHWNICSLALDKDDDTYIACESWDTRSRRYTYKLLIFQKNGELKHQCPLEFLGGTKKSIRIAINNDRKVVIHEARLKHLFIFDSQNGEIDCAFDMPPLMFVLWSISRKNELILANLEMSTLCIYTAEGRPKRTVKLPEDHLVSSAAFHGPTNDILVYTRKAKEHPTSFYILRFSETGELLSLHSVRNWWNNDFYYHLLSHPKGTIALLSDRKEILVLKY